MTALSCESCGSAAPGLAPWRCETCGAPLEIELPAADAATLVEEMASGFWRYRGWLPEVDPVALGEPRTGLVTLPAGSRTVLGKLEGGLPTGSFKDRGAAVTVSWLRARGVREIVVDSSGNAGASFAAYAARAGIRLHLFAPADAPPAKLLQARAHGAVVVTVPGPRSAAGAEARRALEDAAPDVAYASHLWQPAFLAGTATFAYEVFEQLGGQAPDAVVAPLGGGTLLLGASIGFARLRAAGLIERVPRLIGVQSAGCAPLARAFRAGQADAVAVRPAATIADGIRIDRPPRSRQILAAIRETGGDIVEVTDDEIRASMHALSAQGVFVEPTSAAAHAGLARSDVADATGTTVVALTGHGLKASGPIGEILGS
ncbi:MAG: pyridoxal-phosphate dependent enzyme [Chloroflexota bacterium]